MKLLIAGSLFQIPTFGFYRFWLITKLRRHLWANTRIDGEAFEYTGTAKELLIGFLIALAVLTPLYIMTFIASIMLEEAEAFASLPLALIMYVLAHFGVYRARKYRASRTVFRGVRFWMKCSGWAYALRAILWDFATLLSLGLALPWAMASLERYRMRHTYFGSIQGSFVGTGWTLFKRGFSLWLTAFVLTAIVVLIVALKSPFGMMFFPHYAASIPKFSGTALVAPTVIAGFIIFAGAWAVFTRWQIEGLRLGKVACSSTLDFRSAKWVFLKLLFSHIGFVIVAAVLIGMTVYAFWDVFQNAGQSLKTADMNGAVVSASLLGVSVYLIVLLGLGIIQRYFLGRGLWAAIVTTTTITNLHTLDAALAAGQASGVLGEGLADALDFNVGI